MKADLESLQHSIKALSTESLYLYHIINEIEGLQSQSKETDLIASENLQKKMCKGSISLQIRQMSSFEQTDNIKTSKHSLTSSQDM